MKKREEDIVSNMVKDMRDDLRLFDGQTSDWAETNLFRYVHLVSLLQLEGNKTQVKESDFLNPEGFDIYMQNEVIYELTVLK